MWYLRRVVGRSMYPTLRNGQTIVVFTSRNFEVGDVVVAFVDNREVVKRIINKKDGKVFIVGDNEKESTDSRKHGWLIDTHVFGRVVFPLVSSRKVYKRSRSRK